MIGIGSDFFFLRDERTNKKERAFRIV